VSALSKDSPRLTIASDLIGHVLMLRGAPYRLGGDQPATGFDCSGLVRYVFRHANIELPRTVAELFGVGRGDNLKFSLPI
jgi:cell wall-associated NlpC family hydrolase